MKKSWTSGGKAVNFFVEDEIASQPACWRQAAALAPGLAQDLQAPGERVGFVGCGTSWFMAQVLASWRESAGYGESDAFSASEVPEHPGRPARRRRHRALLR
jgi:fructoselysine-6-P-deglycase FrlB-like protein